jgi:hypothetical protein
MDIFCPHCQNHLTIADDHAGQFMKCPLCSGMFTAPTLPTVLTTALAPPPPPPLPSEPAPAPLAPPTQAPAAPEVFSLEPSPSESVSPPPVQTPPVPSFTPPKSVPEQVTPIPLPPPTPSEPEIMLPVGEYKRAFILHFNPAYITWFGPVCLGIIFLLSFFSWYQPGKSLWTLAISRDGPVGVFGPYIFFLLLGLILSIASLLLTMRMWKLPEPVKMVRPWRALIVAAVVLLGFVILFFHWIYFNFNAPENPTTVWYKLAVRLHGLALISLLLEFWLDRRHKKNLPLPKIELHW